MKLYYRKEHDQDPVAFSVGSTLHTGKNDVSLEDYTEVEVIRLRDFLEQFDRVRILKIDIEGAECDVLEDLLLGDALSGVDLTLVETHEEWIPETIPRLQGIRQTLNEREISSVHLNWI